MANLESVYVGAPKFEIVELPEGYTQVEYIESSGTQYIDTGFKPKWNTKVIIDVLNIPGTLGFLFGARDTNSTTATNQFAVFVETGRLRSDYFGTTNNAVVSDSIRTVVEKKANITTAYGVTITNNAVSSGQTSYSMYLFGINNVGSTVLSSSIRLYSCQIYDDITLVRDYIPCTNESGIAGLYDLVNNQFYTNSGTGTFAVGPSELEIAARKVEKIYVGVPTEYTVLEYIESSGTQYIDTLYKPTSEKLRLAIDFEYIGNPSSKCAFGSQDGNGFSITTYGTNEIIIGTSGTINRNYQRPVDTRFLFDITADSGVITGTQNNVTVSGNYTGTILKTKSLYIFHNNGGPASQICSMKLYSCQIYDNDVLVRNFVPCMNENNEVGLYDTVGKQFYSNAGTGAFTGKNSTGVLPDGYTRVEYIESDGNQYIDTGVYASSTLKLVMDAQLTEYDGVYYYFGSREGNDRMMCFNWNVNDPDSGYEVAYASTWYVFTDVYGPLGRHVIELSSSGAKIDDRRMSVQKLDFLSEETIYLFAENKDGGEEREAPMKCYSCKIWDNGDLIRNFIPCKNSSGVAGMFDAVNRIFYANNGSGTFIAGEVVADVEATDDIVKIEKSVAREALKGYISIGGIARQFWGAAIGELTYYGKLSTGLSETTAEGASANVGDYVIIAGPKGEDDNLVNAFNSSLTRTILTDLRYSVSYPGSGSVGDYALFAGGKEPGSGEPQSWVNAYNSSLTLSYPDSLRAPREGLGSASIEGYALFAGGINTGTKYSYVETYDKSLTRTHIADLTTERCDIGGGSIGDYAVFAGGSSSVVEAFNSFLTKTMPTNLSKALSFRKGCCSNGKYLVFGSVIGAEETFVNAYDKSLTRTIPTQLTTACRDRGVCGSDGYALFAGGYIRTDYIYQSIVESYDTSLTKTTVHDLSTARYGSIGGAIGDYILFAGGVPSTANIDAFKII